jgi:hypothetical protein
MGLTRSSPKTINISQTTPYTLLVTSFAHDSQIIYLGLLGFHQNTSRRLSLWECDFYPKQLSRDNKERSRKIFPTKQFKHHCARIEQ